MISDEDLEKVGRMLSSIADQGFTGSIQINFFKGGISNIVKQESYKVADLV